MRTIKILVNPTSGNRAGKKLFDHAKKFNAQCKIEKTDPNNIIKQVKNFITEQDIVVIAGGDGTVNLVINALYQTGLYRTVQVALFPMGTGNDLAKAYKIKKTSLEYFLINLKNRNQIELPLWRFNDRIFINYISWGIDAWALKLVTNWRKYMPQRRWSMHIMYFFAGVLTLFRWRKIHLSSQELSLDTTLLSLILCNTSSYAGGCPIITASSDIQANTPLLHQIKIRHHWDLINLMWRRFSKKAFPTKPINYSTLEINTENIDTEIDGEMLATSKGKINFCGSVNFLV